MTAAYKVPVNAVGKIINAAKAAGVEPEELSRAARLDLSALQDVDNQISFKQLIEIYQQAARLTGDNAFGLHAGELDSPKLYGILGYVTINSPDMGEALNRLVRFQQLRSNAYRFSLEVKGASAQLSYFYLANDATPEERRHESEETLCSIILFGRMLTRSDWIPREVRFEHAEPENISEHERIFRAPVHFSKPATELIFDSSFLEMPLVEADLTLGSLLERQAEELLANSTRHGAFSHQVRQLIKETLPSGEARIDSIGRKLGVSSRTLQRKLREEGTSYQELLEETQRSLAEFYLRKPEIAICEVSYLLGFSQASAFHRAFRRWTGMTVKEFRHKQKP